MKQGAWTDVYALAAAVHHAIMGRTPPPSVGRLLNDTYKPLVQAAAGRYSESFLASIDRALAVRPEARTQSIERLRLELDLHASGPTQIHPLQRTQQALPPTAIVPPGARQGLAAQAAAGAASPSAPPFTAPAAPALAAPDTQVLAPPAAHARAAGSAAKGQGALIGIGAGLLLLTALGFGVWRWMGAQPAAPVAPAIAAAPTPAPAAAPAPFDLSQEMSRVLRDQTAGFGVQGEPLKSELSIAKKDEFKFRITADRDGFLYVLGLSPVGSLAMLIPNKNTPEVRVRKGQVWSFPGKDGFYLPAVEPPGSSRMLVLVSANKRSFEALQPRAEGPIQLFVTGDKLHAAAAAFKGSQSILAGLPKCTGTAPCGDEYAAALMKFETLR